MKAEFSFDTQEIIEEIASKVVRSIKEMQGKNKVENEIIFSVKTLAKYLQVSDQWVYERVSRNEIPFIKIGKFPRFKKNDIDIWLESHKIPVMNSLSRPLKAV